MIKLNNSNWATWKPRMEDFLYSENLHLPIEGDKARPKGLSDENWYIMNRKAIANVRQCLYDSVFIHVAQETNARQLWLKLESLFGKKTIAKKFSLIKRLKGMKCEKGTSVSEHLSDFQGLLNELSYMDVVFEEEVQSLLLLNTLPDAWRGFVETVCDCAPKGVVSMELVKSKMFEEEKTRKIARRGCDLVSDDRGRNRSRGMRSQSRSSGGSQVKERRRCCHCEKQGHIRRNCRVWLREQNEVRN